MQNAKCRTVFFITRNDRPDCVIVKSPYPKFAAYRQRLPEETVIDHLPSGEKNSKSPSLPIK